MSSPVAKLVCRSCFFVREFGGHPTLTGTKVSDAKDLKNRDPDVSASVTVEAPDETKTSIASHSEGILRIHLGMDPDAGRALETISKEMTKQTEQMTLQEKERTKQANQHSLQRVVTVVAVTVGVFGCVIQKDAAQPISWMVGVVLAGTAGVEIAKEIIRSKRKPSPSDGGPPHPPSG